MENNFRLIRFLVELTYLVTVMFFSLSERTNWWDGSFVYGNDKDQLDEARTKVDGKMIESDTPCLLAERKDGTYLAGDNKNSWVGVALLQDLFIREHNFVAEELKKEDPNLTDQEIFVSF